MAQRCSKMLQCARERRWRTGLNSEHLLKRLDHLAASTGRSKAYYLRELVTNGLEDLEDFYLAAATMEQVRKGQEEVMSLDEVERQLGLAD